MAIFNVDNFLVHFMENVEQVIIQDGEWMTSVWMRDFVKAFRLFF